MFSAPHLRQWQERQFTMKKHLKYNNNNLLCVYNASLYSLSFSVSRCLVRNSFYYYHFCSAITCGRNMPMTRLIVPFDFISFHCFIIVLKVLSFTRQHSFTFLYKVSFLQCFSFASLFLLSSFMSDISFFIVYLKVDCCRYDGKYVSHTRETIERKK